MNSIYWSKQGIEDKIAGFPPKTEYFFICWFGESGRHSYQAYIRGYDSARKPA